PSTVHFSFSPAFSHTTMVLLPMPSPNLDLLSFSFHVPSVGFELARHIAPVAIESSRAKPIVFLFILLSSFKVSEPYCFGSGSDAKFAWTNVHLSPFFTKTRVVFARVAVVFPSLS